MEKISLGSVDPETRTIIKKQAVQLHLSGKRHDEIVETLGISYDAVSRIVCTYRKSGKFSEEKTRGRKKGEKRTLSAKQEKEIQRIIIDKWPDEVKLSFALWTRNAVQQLIHDLYGIDMPLRSVSNYLMRWGMTCQIHPKKSCFRDPQKRKFAREKYPFLLKWAQKAKATIYWGAEVGINSQHCHISIHYRNNILFAITGKGTCRFMCYWGDMTPQLFIEFLRRLVMDSGGKPVFLIIDIREVYYGKPVYNWLKKNNEMIKVFFCSDSFL